MKGRATSCRFGPPLFCPFFHLEFLTLRHREYRRIENCCLSYGRGVQAKLQGAFPWWVTRKSWGCELSACSPTLSNLLYYDGTLTIEKSHTIDQMWKKWFHSDVKSDLGNWPTVLKIDLGFKVSKKTEVSCLITPNTISGWTLLYSTFIGDQWLKSLSPSRVLC